MIFLSPFALLFALSIGVLLLLHFRKPKKTHWVSNLGLWQDIEKDPLRRKSIFRILRKNRLRILQILFLTTVVLALARPLITFWSKPSRTLVLILDCSASMNALEDGITRFDRAREEALALTEDVRDADRILLIQARPQIGLDTYAGSDIAAVRNTLAVLEATDAPVDLDRVVTTATESLGSTEPVEIYVISDGTQELANLSALPADTVHVIRVGESGDNVAITALSIRGNPFSAHDRQIFCAIHNFSDRPHAFPLEISLDQNILTSETIHLDSGQAKAVIVDVPAGSNGIIRADIHAADSLEIDNRAFAVLETHTVPVLLGTAGNLFLEKALRVNPRIALTVLKPEACTEEAIAGNHDVVVLDGFEPRELPPGNFFLVNSETGQDAGPGFLMRGIRSITFPRPDHPITVFINPASFSINRGIPLDISDSDIVLMEGNGKPFLTANENGVHRVVKLGFDIRDSNLPVTYSFPVLVSNILNWLNAETESHGNQVPAGSVYRRRLPASDPEMNINVVTPNGREIKPNVQDGVLNFGETDLTGLYTVQMGGKTSRFGVNLFSESESAIKPVQKIADENTADIDRPIPAGGGREAWRWLLLASLLILFLEWRLYLRGAMQ